MIINSDVTAYLINLFPLMWPTAALKRMIAILSNQKSSFRIARKN